VSKIPRRSRDLARQPAGHLSWKSLVWCLGWNFIGGTRKAIWKGVYFSRNQNIHPPPCNPKEFEFELIQTHRNSLDTRKPLLRVVVGAAVGVPAGGGHKENWWRQAASPRQHTHTSATRLPTPPPSRSDLLCTACAPTSTHSNGFCAIWVCISSGSSLRTRCTKVQAWLAKARR
jgi:hypothetical protein